MILIGKTVNDKSKKELRIDQVIPKRFYPENSLNHDLYVKFERILLAYL